MLGHRGCRLGITYPEITEMQTRAIMEAACQLNKEGLKVVPEIMIPLVGFVKEFKDQKAIVERVCQEVMKEQRIKIKYLVGTMIEVPRGAVTADEIAAEAQFFSFGTNDLTQMTFGFSRDDVGKFLKVYQEKRILDADPFASIDTVGVGKLVDMACKLGRQARPDLKLGVCGEHGGDPSSIHFFQKVGLNYVSCSPFRVPVARLAAAHAALSVKARGVGRLRRPGFRLRRPESRRARRACLLARRLFWRDAIRRRSVMRRQSTAGRCQSRKPIAACRIDCSMGKVHRLSPELANQIAAGEVVERPGVGRQGTGRERHRRRARRASSIACELGGKKLIRVEDDGDGHGSRGRAARARPARDEQDRAVRGPGRHPDARVPRRGAAVASRRCRTSCCGRARTTRRAARRSA